MKLLAICTARLALRLARRPLLVLVWLVAGLTRTLIFLADPWTWNVKRHG